MFKEKPLVYIILVNYNGVEDTIECIKSLNKIKYDNYKIVIVDNNSNKKDVEILSKQSGFKLFTLEENIGFAGGNNVGIEFAMKNKADYVLLLNNDTVVEGDFLCKLVETVESDKNIGAVGGKIFYFDNKEVLWYAGAKINKFNGKTKHEGVDEVDSEKYSIQKETDYITGCMMLVSRDVLEKVGMMDDSYFLYYEETDWNVRIRHAGYKLIYNPESIIYHKISKSTKSLNYIMVCYYDRNSYYFIMNNFGIINRIYMFIYKRLNLLTKYIYYIIRGNKEKKKLVRLTYKMIRNKTMGRIDF
ncbi:glycosyltransferase family 2 protein [Clostridium sp. CTA-7]